MAAPVMIRAPIRDAPEDTAIIRSAIAGAFVLLHLKTGVEGLLYYINLCETPERCHKSVTFLC